MATITVYLPYAGSIPGVGSYFGPGVYLVNYATQTATYVSAVPTGAQINLLTRAATTVMVAASNASNYALASADFVCSGSHDELVIQSAINAIATIGGRVVLSEGTYNIAGTIIVNTDNIHIQGTGWGTHLVAVNTLTTTMLQVQEPNYPTGSSGQFRYGFKLSDLYFDGNNNAGLNGLDLRSTYGADLDHIRVRYVKGISIHFNGAAPAFGAYNFLRNSFITDGGTGSIGLQTDNSEWLTISDNNFGFFGTLSGTSNAGTAVMIQNLNCRVTGNSFDNCDVAVEVNFSERCVIANNQFDRGYTSFVYLRGAKTCTVSANLFCGCYSGAGGNLLHVTDTGNQANVITGNTTSNDGTNTWTNFVHEDAASTIPNLYIGNSVSTYGMVLISGHAYNNQGYNPIGQVTAPTFPATTVAAVNATGSDVTAFVANGTGAITQVQIAGTNGTYNNTNFQIAASGWGTIRIPAGGGVKFTYASGAPAWTWFAD